MTPAELEAKIDAELARVEAEKAAENQRYEEFTSEVIEILQDVGVESAISFARSHEESADVSFTVKGVKLSTQAYRREEDGSIQFATIIPIQDWIVARVVDHLSKA